MYHSHMSESREGQPKSISLKQKVARIAGISAVFAAGVTSGPVITESAKSIQSSVSSAAEKIAKWDNENLNAQTEASRNAAKNFEERKAREKFFKTKKEEDAAEDEAIRSGIADKIAEDEKAQIKQILKK